MNMSLCGVQVATYDQFKDIYSGLGLGTGLLNQVSPPPLPLLLHQDHLRILTLFSLTPHARSHAHSNPSLHVINPPHPSHSPLSLSSPPPTLFLTPTPPNSLTLLIHLPTLCSSYRPSSLPPPTLPLPPHPPSHPPPHPFPFSSWAVSSPSPLLASPLTLTASPHASSPTSSSAPPCRPG